MKLSYITIISLCFAFQVQAQQAEKDSVKLSRELTLERDYNPNVRDASKINELPQIKEPEAPKAAIEFSNYIIPFDVRPEIPLLKANSYFADLQSSRKRGYVNLGVSSFIDVDGDLGYQILNSDKDQLSIWGSHRSSNGKVKYLQDDEKQKMKINDNWGGLSYIHKFDNLKIFVDGKYTYSAFNYYGYNDSLIARSDSINKGINQVDNIIDINAGVISNQKEDGLNYMFKVNYSYFSQKYTMNEDISGPKENFIQFDMDMNKNFDSDKAIGFSGYFRNSSYTLNKKSSYPDLYISYENYSDIALNPYFKYDGGNWSVRAGVLLDVLFNYGDNFNIAPDITFNYRPKDNILLYMNVKGGITDNSNNKIYYENRYVSPFYRVFDSYSSFDGDLGIKSAIGNFWFDVFTGYKYAKMEHFYSSNYNNTLYDFRGPYLGNNFIEPLYNDAGVFKIGTELKYKYSDMFDVALKAVYYDWMPQDMGWDGGEYKMPAWNKPNFESDLTIGFKVPDFPLRFNLMYHLETGREAQYRFVVNNPLVYETETVDMKNINQLNLQGTYTINESVSIFAHLNNLMFQKYDLWYGYPAQGFSVMGGVNFKF